MDRYTLGQRILDLLIDILVRTMRAQYQTSRKKIESLEAIIPFLDRVKILVRLTRKLEIINEQTYVRFEQTLHEIGKMLGGWIRNLENKLK